MGLIELVKAQAEVWKFKRSPLGQALRAHTQDFFYSGRLLSWMKEENKQRFVQDFMSQLVAIRSAENSAMALREKLTEYVLLYCELSILALTEEEKAQHMFAANPFITGELHHHIERAAPLSEEMAKIVWQNDGPMSAEELMATANTRSAVALYYANGLNMVRIAIGDTDPGKDWYRPFVEAMMVWEEDRVRDKLGLPKVLTNSIGGLAYSSFMNHVLNGEQNPFFTWTKDWPDLYLAGDGPLPG